ncbi:hypothetical protein ACFWAY_36965 [Rhodococcus sp. NPDC059968]|uniref:hypothetical protein n=1 Tax=Rhodococcus sp. NPDC059968 TaxID=3347017 RepID=UPI003671AEBF
MNRHEGGVVRMAPPMPAVIHSDQGSALRRLGERDARVTRIVAGFAANDVFWSSGYEPSRFTTTPSGSLIVPHLLWELSNGDVLAIDDVQVGFGGAAPRRAFDLLCDLGVGDPVARDIAYSRRSVTNLGIGGAAAVQVDAHDDWPGYRFNTPTRVGASWVLRVSADNLTGGLRPVGVQRTPRTVAGRIGSMIADELDRTDTPAWACGPRIAEIVPTGVAAAAAGLPDSGTSRFPGAGKVQTDQLIVTQGGLQLWFELPEPTQPAGLPPEAHDLMTNLRISTTAATDEFAVGVDHRRHQCS